jgi:hypothetical protein
MKNCSLRSRCTDKISESRNSRFISPNAVHSTEMLDNCDYGKHVEVKDVAMNYVVMMSLSYIYIYIE